MKPALIFTGLGITAPSSLFFYAVQTKHTVSELGWAALATGITGVCLLLMGLAMGSKRRAE